MTSASPPNLGAFVTSPRARKIIYGAYVVAAIAVGGTAAYFLGIAQPLPEQVVGAQAVIAYLGIPIGALALANAPQSPA